MIVFTDSKVALESVYSDAVTYYNSINTGYFQIKISLHNRHTNRMKTSSFILQTVGSFLSIQMLHWRVSIMVSVTYLFDNLNRKVTRTTTLDNYKK